MQFSAAGLSQSATQSSGRSLNPRVSQFVTMAWKMETSWGGAGVKGFGGLYLDL